MRNVDSFEAILNLKMHEPVQERKISIDNGPVHTLNFIQKIDINDVTSRYILYCDFDGIHKANEISIVVTDTDVFLDRGGRDLKFEIVGEDGKRKYLIKFGVK